MSARRNSSLSKENTALQESVRLSDPLRRMRRERWIALLVFNGLLLAAALMQIAGHGIRSTNAPAPWEAPPAIMELVE